MEAKVLPYRGWGEERLPDLYKELQMRAEILTFLSENRPRFRDVWNTVIETERIGVPKVYEKVKKGETPWITSQPH